jgi:hypothetical protein
VANRGADHPGNQRRPATRHLRLNPESAAADPWRPVPSRPGGPRRRGGGHGGEVTVAERLRGGAHIHVLSISRAGPGRWSRLPSCRSVAGEIVATFAPAEGSPDAGNRRECWAGSRRRQRVMDRPAGAGLDARGGRPRVASGTSNPGVQRAADPPHGARRGRLTMNDAPLSADSRATSPP